LLLIWISDIHAIDSSDTDTVLLLIVFHPLPEVPVGLLRVAVVAAAITAEPSVLLYELQSDIEIVGPQIFAQNKTVAVAEQDHSPHYINRILFHKHTFRKNNDHPQLDV